jgi:predicted O-methyltransferase YrrM
MKYFADKILKPYIRESKYISLCEIGAALGGNTDRMLELENFSLSIIDPCVETDLKKKYDEYIASGKVKLYPDFSLNVLPNITKPFDCILIDGDHNWYTVYHELKTIEEKGLIKDGGTIFLHDVCWPYGRRDMYYQPELIPPEFIHPYEKKGMVRGVSKLVSSNGKNYNLCNAIEEGGAKNGVLTAVEDFLKEYNDKYSFFYLDQEYGLGVLLKSKNTFSNASFAKIFLRHFVKESVKHKFTPLYQLLKARQ